MIKNLLLAYGTVALMLFLYSGYAMQEGFPNLYSSDITIRYQYRANHIYLLFSSLLILLYASSYSRSTSRYTNQLNITVSMLFILAHILLVFAFFIEPAQANIDKPLSFYGVVVNLIAVLISLFSKLGQTDKNIEYKG